jgi:hypothetical protein
MGMSVNTKANLECNESIAFGTLAQVMFHFELGFEE